jgi:hypothetical protein
MCDKLVYDLAQEVEGSPSVFVRKDWINILDNQNQNYSNNQSVLDTSQLSNSNKYMSYREAYFSVPFVVTVATSASAEIAGTADLAATAPVFNPSQATTSQDSCVGLKSWFGNIIHSFTVDYNGSTIIQQTPFVNMWNSFKLITSLSYGDLITQGSTLGFYPDDAEAFEFYDTSLGGTGLAASCPFQSAPPAGGAASAAGYIASVSVPGHGACNNSNFLTPVTTNQANHFQNFKSGSGNYGYAERLKWLTFDVQGIASSSPILGGISPGSTYGQLLQSGNVAVVALVPTNGTIALNALWKGYIYNKRVQTAANAVPGVLQYSVVAAIYLKHVHSFFNMIPLLKGVFMKMTMNLNNASCSVTACSTVTANGGAVSTTPTVRYLLCNSVSSALGGSNMLMVTSNATGNGGANLMSPQTVGSGGITVTGNGLAMIAQPYRINLSVGAVCLDSSLVNIPAITLNPSPLSKSIYLYIPAYTFNPTFEQAYLSSPVKQIKYSDIYQYQVLNIGANGATFNNLLTNGINNVKSVLILPFYSSSTSGTITPAVASGLSTANTAIITSTNTGFTSGLPVWSSPFDDAGCGSTSPLCHLTNFNIQVSGQNAIYNLQKYGFEQFNNQLYGQNAVNGGLTDGITSGLIGRTDFDLKYCYYYVNIERMLPVEQSVPKSIQVLGTNVSSRAIDLLCFIEYGTEISIDCITGARV